MPANTDIIQELDNSFSKQVRIVGGSGGAAGAPVTVTTDPVYATIATGELAGSATAVVNPTVACRLVMFKASYDNVGRVYIGISGVTVANGATDTTTGLQLSPGESTPWLPISNVNLTFRISDNTTDDLTYIALNT